MKRIDSINARPNVNGTGKTGFHDNADLSGQDATYLTPKWCNDIQEEIANVIEGFGQPLNGEDKAQLFTILYALAGRIQLLENQIIEDIKIGDLFLTFNHFHNGAAVTAHKGYGKWKRVAGSKALVGRTNETLASTFMYHLGRSWGEASHRLLPHEIPAHNHAPNSVFNKFVAKVSDVVGTAYIESSAPGLSRDNDNNNVEIAVGGFSEAGWDAQEELTFGSYSPWHNNIQPSLIVDVWQRQSDNWAESTIYAIVKPHVGNTFIHSVTHGDIISLQVHCDNVLDGTILTFILNYVSLGSLLSPVGIEVVNGMAEYTFTIPFISRILDSTTLEFCAKNEALGLESYYRFDMVFEE